MVGKGGLREKKVVVGIARATLSSRNLTIDIDSPCLGWALKRDLRHKSSLRPNDKPLQSLEWGTLHMTPRVEGV